MKVSLVMVTNIDRYVFADWDSVSSKIHRFSMPIMWWRFCNMISLITRGLSIPPTTWFFSSGWPTSRIKPDIQRGWVLTRWPTSSVQQILHLALRIYAFERSGRLSWIVHGRRRREKDYMKRCSQPPFGNGLSKAANLSLSWILNLAIFWRLVQTSMSIVKRISVKGGIQLVVG